MLTSSGKIIFTLIILVTFLAFMIPVYYRIRIIRAGLPSNRFGQFGKRLWQAFTKILFQRCTLKVERVLAGLMHVFIFYGALTFDTMTLNHTLEGFIPDFYLFGATSIGLLFSFMVDVFAVLVIVGILYFAFRRFIVRPKAYATTWLDSAIIYIAITLVTLSYLYFEAFAIAHHEGHERWSFLGKQLAASVSGMGPEAIATHFMIAWWLHILLVYAFIAYVPHSKYFHMFAGSFNVLVRRDTPMGELPAMDIENTEVFGIEKSLDYSWKDLLDTFACMECGRCQDACPAFSSDKPLSPKMLIFNLKKHLLESGKKHIAKQRDDLPVLMGGVFSEDEIWTCTTCGACMYVCPVEIEHIPKIIGIRQNQVLMESKFPSELNTFFRNMETNSNPWGIGFSDWATWAEGWDVKLLSEHPEAEYLFWVGCAGSFDEEGKKISQALATILNKAGVDFAILGIEEKCCGDSARRLGNEYLFQMQAAENLEIFAQYKVRKIITICPHGYNTFSHEYRTLLKFLPDLSPEAAKSFDQIEVIHHSQLIAQFIKDGRLPLKTGEMPCMTYHDSCYLGRHNGIVSEPREIIASLKGKFVELPNHKQHSFCCGAGGGLMWTEESLGTRINHKRTDEVIASQAETVVTSCPFCQTMLMDGLKDKDQPDIKVKDIAQIVSESLIL
ncbi:MAG: 4Fe-4S dicluster domain-containing protein [Candidatus Aminicenantes bacterium]|nr:4Fe-4S dicluster domain-containing protein [Candidatus Aminicenantes bacterium]